MRANLDANELTLSIPDAGDATLTLPSVTGTLATLAGTETLSGKTLTAPIVGSGGTAITKVVAANLADDTAGWVPDAAATAFTITDNAASVTATSLIVVSVGVNATDAACGVTTRTASTSFKVKCTAAPANGATLQYMIVNF